MILGKISLLNDKICLYIKRTQWGHESDILVEIIIYPKSSLSYNLKESSAKVTEV